MRRINGLNSLIVRKGPLYQLPKRNFSDRRNFNEIRTRYYFHKNLYFSRIFSLVALGAGIGYQIFHNKVFAQEAQYAPEPEAKTLSKESMPAFALSLLLVQQWNSQKSQQVHYLAQLVELYKKRETDLDKIISYAKKERIQIELILMFANAPSRELFSLSELHKKGVKLDYQDEATGLTALHLAAARPTTKAYEQLIEAAPKLMEMADKNGQMPLHYAASMRTTGLISCIIAYNPELMLAKDAQGRIPYYYVPYYNKEILDAFFKVQQNKKNKIPFMTTHERGRPGCEAMPEPASVLSNDKVSGYVFERMLRSTMSEKLDDHSIDGYMGVIEYIDKEQPPQYEFFIANTINDKDPVGLTRLLFLLKDKGKINDKDLSNIEVLIDKGASPYEKDPNGNNSIMHAHNDLNALESIYKKINSPLYGFKTNAKNNAGYSALMMATYAGNPRTVEFLMAKGAQVAPEGKESLVSPIIIAANCAIAYPEKRSSYLEIIKMLNASDAKLIESKWQGHELTALMVASQAEAGKDEIFEYLYTFIYPNNGNDIAAYEAKKQQEKERLQKEVIKKKYLLKRFEKKETLMTPKKYRILSIDGGGIRGFIPAIILSFLEKDTGGYKISELFDLIVGTSTGGIIGLGLTVPKDEKEEIKSPEYSAAELADIYYDEKNAQKIFTPKIPAYIRWAVILTGQLLFGVISIKFPIGFFQSSSILAFLYGFIGAYLSGYIAGIMPSVAFSRYRRDGLDSLLKSYLKETTLDKALTQVMVTSWAKSGDSDIGESKIFDSDSNDSGVKMWQAAAATSAAPTFFDAAYIAHHSDKTKKFHVDGGIFANNPIQIGINRLLKKGIKLEDIEVVSIGTGWNGAPLSSFDLFMFYLRQQFQGQAGWILPLINIMTESEKVEKQMEELFKNTGNYFRIQLTLNRNLELDDLSSIREISQQCNIKREIEQNGQKQMVRFFVPDGKVDEIRKLRDYTDVVTLLKM